MAIVSFNRQASKDEMAREIDRCHAVIEKYEAEASRSPVSQEEAGDTVTISVERFKAITAQAERYEAYERLSQKEAVPVASALCSDCPPFGYLPDETRCTPCPRRSSAPAPAGEPAPFSVHQFTGDGPGIRGADNCQICGRWGDQPETEQCRDKLDAGEPVVKALDEIAEEARRYAGFYPEASDGRNTFIIFAEWIERRSPTPVSAPVGVVEAIENLALPIVGNLFVARGGATVRRVEGLENGPDENSELVRVSDVREALTPILAALRSPAVEGE